MNQNKNNSVHQGKPNGKPHGLIPFYIPHAGCPQQCVFCNQHRIAAGGARATQVDVKATIDEYIGTLRDEKYWEVAFYGGSFSALPRELQQSLLEPAYEALQTGKIDAIRCSTRPDALGETEIGFLKKYGMTTVEIGVQSMDDDILKRAKRGHSAAAVVGAVKRLKDHGFTVGIQLLPGLPGEDWHTLVNTAVAVGALKPDFVRIYPVLVIEDTELADDVRAGRYTPLSVDEAVKYSAFFKTYFEERGITVIRTGLQSTPDLDAGVGLVGGPYEPAMGELVTNYQWLQRILDVLSDHVEAGLPMHSITVLYPRQLTSKVRGEKQRNMKYLRDRYSSCSWQWYEIGSKKANDLYTIKTNKFSDNVLLFIDNFRYNVI